MASEGRGVVKLGAKREKQRLSPKWVTAAVFANWHRCWRLPHLRLKWPEGGRGLKISSPDPLSATIAPEPGGFPGLVTPSTWCVRSAYGVE